MKEFINETVSEFVFELSSKKPAPGGGGASALVGALGAALGGMVANLTIGKEKYADAEEELKSLKIAAYRVQKDLLELIDKDAEAFLPLAGAYRMPSGTEEERESKNRVMEAALKEASLVPLAMMKKCAEAISQLEVFAAKGSVLAVSDAGCGAVLAKAAMQSAWLNVRVNTRMIKDETFANNVNAEGEALLAEYLLRADAIYENVHSNLTEN